MTEASEILLSFLKQAWTALAGGILIFGLLAMLAHTLRAGASAVLGSRFGLAETLGSAAGLLLLILFAWLVVPPIVQAVELSAGGASTCEPLADLGLAAAGLIGAMAAVRMLAACFLAVVSAAGGASAAIPAALAGAGESILGMLLAVVSGPVAAHFFGLC